jgi:hypothetical protein
MIEMQCTVAQGMSALVCDMLGFSNVIHAVEIIKQNYSGVHMILLDRSRVI